MSKHEAISVIRELGAALNRIARPYLTALVATIFNLVCAWAVWKRLLPIRDYILAVGPTNAMIIGFWFGEKSALKSPSKPEEEPK